MSEPAITITREQLQDAISTGAGPISLISADRLWKKLGGKETTEKLLDEARLAISEGGYGTAADVFSRLDNELLNGGKLPEPWLDAAIETLKDKYGQNGIVFLNYDEAESLAEFLVNAMAREGHRVCFRDSSLAMPGDRLKANVARWLAGWRKGKS